MPNRKKHKQVGAKSGATVSAATYLLDYFLEKEHCKKKNLATPEFNLLEFLGTSLLGAGAGALGGILPDVLEPARNPHHRKTMHSVTTMVAVTGVVVKKKRRLTRVQKSLLNATGAGYVSHLALDSQTPMGLPPI